MEKEVKKPMGRPKWAKNKKGTKKEREEKRLKKNAHASEYYKKKKKEKEIKENGIQILYPRFKPTDTGLPRPFQLEIHQCRARWRVVVAHRRFGKTNLAIMELIFWAASIPKSRFAYIAPYKTQAKKIAWDMLKDMTMEIPWIKYNETELRADFPNWARISLYGADNPDGLRGIALWGIVYDEYSQQPSNIHREIVRPALSDHNGWAMWIGTPKWPNNFKKMYDTALKEQERGNTDYAAFLYDVTKTGVISEKELEDARKGMSSDDFEQEFLCSFDIGAKGSYYGDEMASAKKEGRFKAGLYDSLLPVYTAWDIGVHDYMSIIFFQIYGNELRIIDFYQNNKEGFPHYAKVLNEKGYLYEAHYLPHDISVTEVGTWHTRLETFEKLFPKVDCIPVTRLTVKEGIDIARMYIYRMWFDSALYDDDEEKGLISALYQYWPVWDDRKDMFTDKPRHDWTSHPADAFRYMSVAYHELLEEMNTSNDTITETDYNLF